MENIYIVKKPWNDSVTVAMSKFIRHIHECYPAVNVIVSDDVGDELLEITGEKGIRLSNFNEDDGVSSTDSGVEDLISGVSDSNKITLYTGTMAEIVDKTDLVVTLGGDGTILRAVSTFLNSNVPPVLSFALGTLGFLLPFDFSKFKETFAMMYDSRAKALHRSRLECHVIRKEPEMVESAYSAQQRQLIEKVKHQHNHSTTMIHAMNDISLHRGLQPNLTSLDVYVDNSLLTSSTADGLIFSTPTGSTAYSLSAGGSITHPSVECILLTPICPRSLSFRPLILPLTLHIRIQMSERNRNAAIKLSIDGIPQQDLRPGDQIHVVSETGTIFMPGNKLPKNNKRNGIDGGSEIDGDESSETPDTLVRKKSPYKGIWCVARSETDWTTDINNLLGFNSSFRENTRKS